MKTKVYPPTPQRYALHLLCSCALLGGLVGMHAARAEEKIDLVETPLSKKIKLEKPTALPEAAHTSDKASAPATGKAGAAAPAGASPKPAEPEQAPAGNASVRQLKEVLSAIGAPGKKAESPNKRITLTAKSSTASTGHSTSSRDAIRARALALANGEKPADAHATGGHGGEAHWAYEGEGGPQNWGKLKPEFSLCAIGKRQSPIAIRDEVTLLGPAEPIRFVYTPSRGNVVNNGHTIQVDMDGENYITVRGSSYKLLQFHFHTPSEEMINSKRYAMVAHLVHKNDEGQLAVVAVLLEPGEPNPMIETVWTYMPLDTNDRVRIPEGMIDMNQLLPEDQRYYQFMGSLTTPPCTEGVLWMVMKQPLRISPAQFRVFTQLFPLNARPVQPLNARPVREAK
jgi:carbonic anhydrase